MVSSSRGGGRAQHDLVHRVARRLAAIRRERGLSQENLAAVLGMATKNLQRIESGRQNLSLATIERICIALDASPAALFSGGGPDADAHAGGRKNAPQQSTASTLERLAGAGFAIRAATSRGRMPANAVPVTTLRAAAGHLTGEARAIEVIGHTVLARRGAPPAGQFVAEVRGRSMEPRIPGGSIALFGPAEPAPYGDRVLLVAHASIADDELGGPYALKRIGSVKKLRSGKTRVTLESTHPDIAPISVVVADDELRVVAELVGILVSGAG